MILNVKEMKDKMQHQMVRQRHQDSMRAVDQDSPPSFDQKWPSQVFAFFHPFNLSENLDMMLKDYFDLSMPFLNVKLGI